MFSIENRVEINIKILLEIRLQMLLVKEVVTFALSKIHSMLPMSMPQATLVE
jgi:hypothetical protein